MQQLSTDIFRPSMHFSPPFGWMNDPNGLVYINQEYHLFYQYYPYGNKWGPMHWGHAVSADLLRWQHLPPALVPDDTGMCFSGSAVIDWHNASGLFDDQTQPGIMAFYTACIAPTDGTDGIQMQSLAYSKDGGLAWEKLAQNPILANPGLKDFRDPKVIWHPQSKAWIMVVTEGQAIGFYRSLDLKNWEKTSLFGEDQGAHDALPWECPDLFPIQLEGSDKTYWALIVGVQGGSYAGGSGTQYFIGHFDGFEFTNQHDKDQVLWLDYGRDYYAAQTWADVTDGTRVAIAWMNNWQYANEVPTQSWRGAMSAPRTLTLDETSNGLRLLSRLPKEWSLDTLSRPLQSTSLRAGESHPITASHLAGVLSAQIELTFDTKIELRPFGNQSLVYTILRSKEGYHITTTRIVAEKGEPNYEDTFAHQTSLTLPTQEQLQLTALIDHSSCELLLQNGEFCLTDLAFDKNMSSFEVTCLDGHCHLSQLSFCQPNTIQSPAVRLA